MDRITDGRELLKLITFADSEDIDAREAWEIEAWLDALCYQWTDEYWQIPENVNHPPILQKRNDWKINFTDVSIEFKDDKILEAETVIENESESANFYLNEKIAEDEFNEALNYIFNINEAVMSLGVESSKKTVICLLNSSLKLIGSRLESLLNDANLAEENMSLADVQF